MVELIILSLIGLIFLIYSVVYSRKKIIYLEGENVKNFLIDEFGQEEGEKIYQKQQEKFNAFMKQISTGKSNGQLETLKNSIIPRIALYRVLQEIPTYKELALQIVEKGFLQDLQRVVLSIQKMEESEHFFEIFRMNFSESLKCDNWESKIIQNDNNSMVFIMKKCLWYDTCIEMNCPEMCQMFCKGDIVCYGSINKITFERTQALGCGGECCDFKFINNEAK
ncbi:hypothetical protein CLOBY_33940 [Clostridium saccharobutylicum]|nr:hypothetical protein CLOBY_33940 [Clostridium saccharobutylicum]OOM18102.1 hypothetical protein CLSAB_10380 [Clostridium saccharobutylicum]